MNTSIINNTADSGQGGGIFNTGGGTVTIRNSTLSGNSTSDSGGGIAVTGSLLVQNSTIVNNTAGASGGGISKLITAAITLDSTIVSGNVSPAISDIATTSLVTNNSAIGSTAGVTFTGANNLIGQNLKQTPATQDDRLARAPSRITWRLIISAISN